FAILLWEISSHKIPFDDVEKDMKVRDIIISRKRPDPFPAGTPEKYKEIIVQAWDHDFNNRPPIKIILEKLEGISLLKTPNMNVAISLHNSGHYREAFPHFQMLAQKDSKAAYYAGLYLYKGTYGIEKNEITALLYLGKSAESGYTRGQYLYAHACLKGIYYEKDEGIKYLKKAVYNDDPDALYMYSQLYLNGEHDFPVDNSEYMCYLRAAAEKGSKDAIKELESKEKETTN
ncbi:10045_t:CDS:1, partial [Acaulospora colombiana]